MKAKPYHWNYGPNSNYNSVPNYIIILMDYNLPKIKTRQTFSNTNESSNTNFSNVLSTLLAGALSAKWYASGKKRTFSQNGTLPKN